MPGRGLQAALETNQHLLELVAAECPSDMDQLPLDKLDEVDQRRQPDIQRHGLQALPLAQLASLVFVEHSPLRMSSITRRTSRTVPLATSSDLSPVAMEQKKRLKASIRPSSVAVSVVLASGSTLVGVGPQLVLLLQVHGDAVDLGATEWGLETRSLLLGPQQQHTDSYDTVITTQTDRQTDRQTDNMSTLLNG